MNIGKHITITKAQNKELIGKNGTIIDETKHTITLQNGKKIIKKQPNRAVFFDA